MILVDTSAWVEFDRATGSRVDTQLTELIATTDEVAVTQPVIMEVLAGALDDRRANDLRRLVQRFPLLQFDAAIDFDAATRIYRMCRGSGVTAGGMIDCMIAAVASRHGASLLTNDTDLDRVAAVVGIPMHPPDSNRREASDGRHVDSLHRPDVKNGARSKRDRAYEANRKC